MAGLIPDSFLDDLLARVDIVEVVERRVPLKKAGREWTACCPFHNERTPSFTVSPQKQFYHCFGCGVHGTAIGFLMDYEHLEFPDAIEELAHSVGMQVPRSTGRAEPSQRRTDLYGLLDDIATHYQRALDGNEAAQAYCRMRGLDADTLARFRIGWASRDGVLRKFGTRPERVHLLEEAGMVSSGEGGKYDRFRERLMFPILDHRGRVIAFGGRVLGDETPKYLNSPETPLFHKGRELFALWQVKQASTQLPRLLVVEGYMDALAVHQAGLPIAVATLGTATTNEHAERLFRSAPDVVFAFDGDRAGRAAAWRALEAVLPHLRDGRQAWFMFLPDGEDPDTVIHKHGKDDFETRMRQAKPLSEYLFEQLAADIDMSQLDGRARLAERARPLLMRLPDGAFRDLMQQELTRRSGVQAPRPAPPRRGAVGPRGRIDVPLKRSLVRTAITLLVTQPLLARLAPSPCGFESLRKPGIDLLMALIEAAREREDMTTAMLLQHFAEHPEAGALGKLAMVELPATGDALHAEFAGALEQLQRQTDNQRIGDLTAAQIKSGLSAIEKTELRTLLAGKSPRPRAT